MFQHENNDEWVVVDPLVIVPAIFHFALIHESHSSPMQY